MEGPATEIRVLLVDDHAIERQGVRSLLEVQPDICVVGEAGDGLEALPLVGSCHPDVVITETIMPRMNGLELTGQILRRYPDLKVLVLTRNEREDCVLRLVQAGAGGYLLKTTTSDELARAIRSLSRGEPVLHPDIARKLMRGVRSSGDVSAESLTSRELEVLALLARRLSNKEIAAELGIAEKTVKTHVSNILSKLSLESRVDAARYAREQGLGG